MVVPTAGAVGGGKHGYGQSAGYDVVPSAAEGRARMSSSAEKSRASRSLPPCAVVAMATSRARARRGRWQSCRLMMMIR